MKAAFDLFKDQDGCISVHQLFERIKDKQPADIYGELFYAMIQRICDFKDMRSDPRINFEEFKRLTFKAMKTRSRKKHIALLFKIMDQDNTGRVHAHNLCRVS